MDMRFGTVASELAKCNLDLVAVQDVTWDKGGSEPAQDRTFYMEMGTLIIT
jgi:hypothetical protein